MRKVRAAIKRRISERPLLAAVVDRLRKRPLWHRVRRRISGKRNRWQADWTCVIDDVSVEIHGNNNSIEIGAGSVLRKVSICIWGDGHRISLGDNVRFNRGGTLWFEDAEGILAIGSNTTVEAADISITERGSSVEIGRDCMLAHDIDIRTGDSHSVLDAHTQR